MSLLAIDGLQSLVADLQLFAAGQRANELSWTKRLLAHIAIGVFAIGMLLGTSYAFGAETVCKHNTTTSNTDCKPRDSRPWVYEAEGISPPVTGKSSFDAALAQAFLNVPNYYFNFCYYDYQINNPPWVTTLTDPDYSKREDKDYYVTGTVWAGTGCGTAIQQDIHLDRVRTNFCAPNWFETYDGLGSLLCYRVTTHSPPARCEGTCGGTSPPTGGAMAGDPAWIDGVYAHNGE